ncbi:MAG: hypothetical protein COB74_04095 [Shewanella sp.]|nr:MAG: hypothetical protein COB74_04095 [Shewanella sp.]
MSAPKPSALLSAIFPILTPLLLTSSFPAHATDGIGYSASAFIILVLGGFLLMNLMLNGLFFFAGKYQNKGFSRGHTSVSLILPAIALIWTLVDHVGFADLALNIGLITVAVGLALLPLQLSLHQRAEHGYTSLLLILGAIGFLALSYLVQPIAIFALASAHIALTSQSNTKAKVLSILTLIGGYSVLAYWGVQTLQVFTQ